MFDRYEVRPGGGTHYHTITENRAPTDESVRLLKEMETAARDKVQASIRVENCPVDCVLNAWEDWQSAGDRHFAIKCRINNVSPSAGLNILLIGKRSLTDRQIGSS